MNKATERAKDAVRDEGHPSGGGGRRTGPDVWREDLTASRAQVQGLHGGFGFVFEDKPHAFVQQLVAKCDQPPEDWRSQSNEQGHPHRIDQQPRLQLRHRVGVSGEGQEVQKPTIVMFTFPERKVHVKGIFSTSEDPATGSAAGCTAAWMVRYGIAQPEETVHILQGVEIKRPSHIFMRAGKDGDSVKNVRVGGHAAQIMEGTVSL